MARIPAAEIERLKSDISVERLVEDAGIPLRRAGKDLLGICPFHEDGEPSLVVTPAKNLWHCFGCGAAGGPIDWVMRRQGVSFRHAVEVLREGLPSLAAEPDGDAGQVKRSSVRALLAPVALDGDDAALLRQTVEYYHERLLESSEAQAYLAARGLDHPELVRQFKLGVADRTLGLRLPEKNRKAGAEIRARLQKVGVIRESGHEHLNGSLVVPIFGPDGQVLGMYGRKLLDNLRPGTAYHLYLPGPHRGVWNEAGLAAGDGEVILCEALLDAMTFWCAGYRNVTASYGTQGFTDDHVAAFQRHGITRVLIAYDRDEAGDRAAAELATRLRAGGFGVWRLQFPKGMDANEYACKVQPAAKSLGVLIRSAQWLGDGQAPQRTSLEEETVVAEPVLAPEATHVPARADLLSLAAEPVAAESVAETPLPARVVPPAPQLDLACEVSEQEVVLHFGEGDERRRWRVRGLPKNLAIGVLKVNVMVASAPVEVASGVPAASHVPAAGPFHVDTLDLYAARARTTFVQQAANELKLPEGVLKTDLGRVLLKLEALQDERLREALEPKEVALPQMTEVEREAALTLLRAPDLTSRILADFEACGAVGEATNKLTAYLAATSRLLERPLAVVIQSSSAAGKTSLMDAVLAFMPPEAAVRYSAMSGQSLFYMGSTNLKHKVLALAEEEGASRASYALKLLQSDGALTMASTGTDANGNLITQEYRVEGPVSLFTTTTAIDVDEELLNRCLVLSVDEGREQTAAIHRRQRERRTLAGLRGQESREAVLNLHRNAQRLLRPLAVVNPYADRLTFLDDRTRTRRDHDKYLSLIDTVALLHQYQRSVKTLSVAGRHVDYIEVTPADIAQANALAHEVLGRSLDELPAQTRKLLVLVRDFVIARMGQQGVVRAAVRFSRREVRDATGWGDTQLKVHLGRLADLEYLLVHRNPQGGYGYELLYDGDGRSAPYLSGLIDPASLGYDGARSGENPRQSVSGRGVVGGESAPGQPGPVPENTGPARLDEELPGAPAQTRHPLNGKTPPYPTAGVLPLAAAGV